MPTNDIYSQQFLAANSNYFFPSKFRRQIRCVRTEIFRLRGRILVGLSLFFSPSFPFRLRQRRSTVGGGKWMASGRIFVCFPWNRGLGYHLHHHHHRQTHNEIRGRPIRVISQKRREIIHWPGICLDGSQWAQIISLIFFFY